MPKPLTLLILRAVALAMSVAVLVLSTLGSEGAEAYVPLLATGLFTLVLSSFVQAESVPVTHAPR